MNKKDEALKKCLRVLNPIADEKVYETQWIDSAIYACHEALAEKEWQELSNEEINELLIKHTVTSINLGGASFYTKELIQKLKEKNS